MWHAGIKVLVRVKADTNISPEQGSDDTKCGAFG